MQSVAELEPVTSGAANKAVPDHLAPIEERVSTLMSLDQVVSRVGRTPETSWIWGVPFSHLTLEQTLWEVDRKIASGEPGFFVTANLNYVMLSHQTEELGPVNLAADFILADGMPIVWRSRAIGKRRLPERVAGSDLIYAISQWSAAKGYRVYFLGGAPGIAEQTAECLCGRYPGLMVAGTECPPFRQLSADEEDAMIGRVRDSQADILFVALGQPKGEIWLAKNRRRLGVPVSVQLGASFDFVVGKSSRSPAWAQRIGMEWLYRMVTEPVRLGPRYAKNACFLAKAMLGELLHGPTRDIENVCRRDGSSAT